MARKGVEKKETMETVKENNEANATGLVLDINPAEELPRPMIPAASVPENTGVAHEVQAAPKKEKELVNCLRNEKVIIKFVPKETAMVHSPNHVLYGGMAETATRSFVVPRLSSTGHFKNPLTNDEKNFLEYALGLEPNALSIYRQNNNFWDDSNPNGIGRVTLRKHGNILDLSIPVDYIKYKILLLNKDQIASSLEELENRPKATYQFVIISENSETKSNLSRMEATSQCYMEFGAVKDDKDTLRTIIEQIEKRPTSPHVKLDYLQSQINNYIQKDPRGFLKVITDNLLPAKVLIRRGQEAGLISWRNNLYYLRQDNSPLCEMGEESTLTNAARYISSPKHQELKFMLEAKLKEE